MVRALRVMTVERGVDPRGFALLAFGGAGPLHAAAIAEELGMTASSALARPACWPRSASSSPTAARDASAACCLAGDERTDEAHQAFGGSPRSAAGTWAGPEHAAHAASSLPLAGQSLPVLAAQGGPDGCARASPRFTERYGYPTPRPAWSWSRLRVTAALPGPEVSLERAAGAAPRPGVDPAGGIRRARACEAAVWRGELAPGTRLEGPAVCELPEATLVVAPGWIGEVDATGAVGLERS